MEALFCLLTFGFKKTPNLAENLGKIGPKWDFLAKLAKKAVLKAKKVQILSSMPKYILQHPCLR